MALWGSKLLVAFDAGSVTGAVATWGVGGPRLRAFAGAPLASGAILPAPLEGNLARADEVRGALATVRASLGGNGRGASLILPDGVARMLLINVPDGAAARDYARFRLSQGLAYPVDEAIVDTLPLGRKRCLCAAVRRGVVEEYESVAAAAGFTQERLDLTPFAALGGLLRQPPASGRAVDVILGDAAFSLAAFQDGALAVFRNRRRDAGPDEARRLLDEVDRTANLAGEGPPPRLRVVGPGARALIQDLVSDGRQAEPGWQAPSDGLPVEAAELAWLGAALG